MSGSERTPTGPLSPPSGSNGRKRVPLGPFSPNSKQTEKRRVHCPINSDMQNRGTISENSDPNIQMSGTGSSLTNEPSLLSPSQRKLLGLQATGNAYSRPLGRILEQRARNLNKQSPIPSSRHAAHQITPTDVCSFESLSHLHDHISTGTPVTEGSHLTPSQRRLNHVNLSGIGVQSPVSRLINSNGRSKNVTSAFQLPASVIRSRSSRDSDMSRQRLLDSFNRDRGVQGPHARDLKCNKTALDPRILDTSILAKRKEDRRFINVTVPEPEQLGIKPPDWFRPIRGDLGARSAKEDRVQASSNAEASTSGIRNLISEFNEADSNPAKTDLTPQDQVYESLLTDDDIDDEEAHRGEYLSDAEEEHIGTPDLWKGYMNLGPPSAICHKCKARMWNEERNNKSSKNNTPTFSLCCKDGQVKLPQERPPPPFLASLLHGHEKTEHFKQNIRTYNALFQFTSLGGKIDKSINNGGGPYCFKLNGQNYHLIGSLTPTEGDTPKFCQLYVYDTENEIQNRMNAVPGTDQLDPEIVEGLLAMLDQNNKLAEGFRMARDRFNMNEPDEFDLLLVSSKSESGRPNQVGPSNEVAALIVADSDDNCPFRDIVVQTKQMYLKRVFETCKHFMQLQYPLLFPYGDDGFHLDIPLHNNKKKVQNDSEHDLHPDETKHRTTVTMREFYAYKLMVRPDEGKNLHLGGRLWQQFVVDAFAAVEQYRLDWIRGHQHIIRSELYKSIRDSVQKGDTNPETLGKKVILPATHTGSQRYMNQYFKDSLAICRTIGHPSLFLTMTCNTQWPEINSMLEHLPGVAVSDAPDIVARVFKLKLDQLVHLIKKQDYFGKCIGVMHVIEFQKRGLPHCHMLIWLHPSSRPKNVKDIDKLISAEIPDEHRDPVGYNVVKRFMIHGPCGKDYTYSPCMIKGRCGRHFPKKFNGNTFFDDSGFPVYRRRRTSHFVKKKGILLDNQYVVPYNRDLLVRFQCHINLEVCNSSRSLKYLFKYCLKGHDTATMLLRKKNQASGSGSRSNDSRSRDEIKNYLDGRYICAAEAAWRLLGFDIHYRHPSVERLPVHNEGEKNVTFKNSENLAAVAEKAKTRLSKLEGWFEANKLYPEARELTYQQFPQSFTWKADACRWKYRERGTVFGRLTDVHASSGETFFLRMILMQNKGATSFKSLRTVNGVIYKTFKEACSALGLLKDDRQWHVTMSESAVYAMPRQLRELFVHIISNNQVADPLKLWEQHWVSMSDDILYLKRKAANDMSLRLDDQQIYNLTLTEVEKLLNDVGKSLKDYSTLPYPDERYIREMDNRLITEEMSYSIPDMVERHEKLHKDLNKEQLNAYNSIIQSVNQKKGGVFFVYGSGGCGKTFLWNTICCRLRSERKIVLPVASSGIAATLLPGGRTAHSRFHIPLKIDPHSVAGIKHGSELAELIKQTSLIIWDEAPMQHRHAFECVDRSLRDIMSSVDPLRAGIPFGGISIVFGGDYRQILPVIPKASRAQVVNASLNSSRLWERCHVFLLKKNMRLSLGKTEQERKDIAEFSQWVLDVGNGLLPNIHPDDTVNDPDVVIPDRFLVRSSGQPIKDIVDVIYPDIATNLTSTDYLKQRSILTPTNAIVNDVNSYILDLIPGTVTTYFSQDSLSDSVQVNSDFGAGFPVEYLNSINMPGLPRHDLKIKVGSVSS